MTEQTTWPNPASFTQHKEAHVGWRWGAVTSFKTFVLHSTLVWVADWQSFATALASLDNLEDIEVQFPKNDDRAGTDLDIILNSFIAKPSLKRVSLRGHHIQRSSTDPNFGQLATEEHFTFFHLQEEEPSYFHWPSVSNLLCDT
jgi:hypothetical protein